MNYLLASKTFILYNTFIFLFHTTQINAQSILDKKQAKKIDNLANRYLELGRFSGSILIAKGKSVIFHKNYGKANYKSNIDFSNRTAFKIGKLTELFTKVIILSMVKKIKFNFMIKFHCIFQKLMTSFPSMIY